MNSVTIKRLGFWLLAILIVASPAFAQNIVDDDFLPDSSAPPAKRTGGASRGGTGKVPHVSVLAPADSVGLTTREQPVIYWYLSADTKLPIAVGINSPKNLAKPVLETEMAGPKKAGLHKLDLTALKQDGKPIKLEPGVKYEVAISVVDKEASGSENPTATCRILRVEAKDAPAAAATEKDDVKRASIYGKAGVWFDYLDALNAAIDAKPKDEALLKRRASALASQGLIWSPDGTIAEKPAASKETPEKK